ncbi:MAG: hypothetical protein Kow00109_06130 [Acidobacteriota bacterium]
MKKALLILAAVALVLILVVGIGVYWLFSNLDDLVRQAVERYGTELTGTQVTVESVSLSLSEGRGTFRGLRVANPEGFTPGDAIRVGEIALQIDPSSIQNEPIVLGEVRFRDVFVLYERSASGAGNLETIRDRLSASGGGAEEPATGKAPRRFRIERLQWNEGRLEVRLPQRQEPLELELPAVEMTSVGGPSGAPPSELGKIVLQRFLENTIRAAAQRGIERFLEEKLPEGIGDKAKRLLESIIK